MILLILVHIACNSVFMFLYGSMATDTTRRAEGTHSRSKEIYRAMDGKVIDEDELLNFIVVKMRTLGHDEIVLLVTHNFSSERIESSKKTLFEVCPNTSQRCVTHKGAQKDINNVKMCLKVLNECGEDIPRFVSHYIDDLPPVTFNRIDVSALFGRIEQINNDICQNKRTLETQTNACDSLRVVTANLDHRLSDLEKPGSHGDAGEEGQRQVTTTGETPEQGEPPADVLPPIAGTRSPAWNLVVKGGRRLKSVPENSYSREKPRSTQTTGKRERKHTGITGTSMDSNIRAVKTKLVSVFATRFDPSLDADTLGAYLKDRLGREVKCRKIETAYSRFSSFHVSAECGEVAELYDPQLWPDGCFVRRYYEKRWPRDTTGVLMRVDGPGMSGQ